MERNLSVAVRELGTDLDLWTREAARGNSWSSVQKRTLDVLSRVETGLAEQGFKKKAREVSNLSQRLAGPIPDFSGSAALINELAKLILHAETDRAA